MNERPRQTLCALIAKDGPAFYADLRRCEALLRDDCGECECEIQVLMVALKKKVPDVLANRNDSMPWASLLCLQAERLHGESGLDRDKARWAVESWALALGVISPGQLSTSRPPTGRQLECLPGAADPGAQQDAFIVPMVTVNLAVVVVMAFIILAYLVPALFGVAIAAGVYCWFSANSCANRRSLWGWLIQLLSCRQGACGNRTRGTCVPDCGNCDCLIILRRSDDLHEGAQQPMKGCFGGIENGACGK